LIHPLGECRILAVFLDEMIQGTDDGCIAVWCTGGNEIIKIKQVIPGEKGGTGNLPGVKCQPRGVSKAANGIAAQVVADKHSLVCPPLCQFGQGQ